MRKKIISILFLLQIFNNLFGQNDDCDSLRKYSYFIFGYKRDINDKIQLHTGTVTFLVFNNRIFLITAKHVLSDKDGNCRSKLGFPKYMNVYLSNPKNGYTINYSDSSKKDNTKINVNTQSINKLNTCRYFNQPDTIKYEISNKTKLRPNTIEHFDTGIPDNKGELVIFGYPLEQMKDDPYTHTLTILQNKIIIQPDEYAISNKLIHPVSNIIDTVEYMITSDKFPFYQKMPGYSGAPVFIKNKRTDKWNLIGIVSTSAILDGYTQLLVTKFRYIF